MHKKILEQLRKVKSICKTAMVCKKIKNACGVNDTACTVHAVSLIPHAWCMHCHWHRMHVCMQCHWYRMHDACGVIDTACKMWHRMQDRRMIPTALAAFKGNIYQ
jgi:hypothetical protein